MKKALLIQANGNNVRLGRFFKQPKYELFYKNKKIIDHIYNNIQVLPNTELFIAVREDATLTVECKYLNILRCKPTYSRLDTLRNILNLFEHFDELIIHDCDVIIEPDILLKLKGNSLAVSTYKNDGLKYGFVELDESFTYIKGNEKEYETDYIAIGAYSVNLTEFREYIKTATEESLLMFFNKHPTSVVYSKNSLNLGDIDSYLTNLWKL